MNFVGYRLLSQLGAGRDGVAYRGEVLPEGLPVEIRVVSAARSEASRWPLLVKQLRQVALLEHPAALRLRELGLEQDPPYVVLESVSSQSLAAAFQDRIPLPLPAGVALVQEIADALAAAHRLGLRHGRLCPSALSWTARWNGPGNLGTTHPSGFLPRLV